MTSYYRTREQDELTRALVTLADHGERPRCGDPATHGLWLSDNSDDRKQAARWCRGCPVLGVCAAAAAEETFGVWGAVDRSVSTKAQPSTTQQGEP